MPTPPPNSDTPSTTEAPLTILLADDDNDSREYLKILLTTAGHRVIEAENGQQAIDAYQSQKPDIVFMDVIMPVIDGYEATKIIKSIDSHNHVPVLFITSLTDNESLLKCIDAGGDDFLTKPYNAILLYAKLNAHSRIINLTQGLKKQNDLLDFFRRNTEREHRIAERVFNKRLALGQTPSPHVRHHFSAMAIFNGDIYQCVTSRSGDSYLLLGDFTGHGLAAATGTLPVSDAFISQASENQPLGAIAASINNLLKDILPGDMFCAATILRLNPKQLHIEIWGGGLPATFLANKKTKNVRVLEPLHMPLGILTPQEFDNTTQIFDLSADDRLYVYTDGITETINNKNEMFGEERLKNLLSKYCDNDNVILRIVECLTEFSENKNQRDDISIIEVSASPAHSLQA